MQLLYIVNIVHDANTICSDPQEHAKRVLSVSGANCLRTRLTPLEDVMMS